MRTFLRASLVVLQQTGSFTCFRRIRIKGSLSRGAVSLPHSACISQKRASLIVSKQNCLVTPACTLVDVFPVEFIRTSRHCTVLHCSHCDLTGRTHRYYSPAPLPVMSNLSDNFTPTADCKSVPQTSNPTGPLNGHILVSSQFVHYDGNHS